jgi:hypothetical protein
MKTEAYQSISECKEMVAANGGEKQRGKRSEIKAAISNCRHDVARAGSPLTGFKTLPGLEDVLRRTRIMPFHIMSISGSIPKTEAGLRKGSTVFISNQTQSSNKVNQICNLLLRVIV